MELKKGKIKFKKYFDSFFQNNVKIGIWNLMENTNFGISNFLENPADIGVIKSRVFYSVQAGKISIIC